MCHDAGVSFARWVAIGATCAAAITGGLLLLRDSAAGDPEPTIAVSPTTAHGEPQFSSGSSTSTTVSPTATTDAAAADLAEPRGFELTAARVSAADGTVCEVCLWLADTVELRNRGLMGVTDLGPADGMAFVYPEPHTTQFWMKDTLLPLSIAFVASNGEFLDSFDMEPCVALDSSDCTRYPTAPDFLVAVETVQGELGSFGMLPGSTLELLDQPCPIGVVPEA